MTQVASKHYFAGTHQEIETSSEDFKTGYLAGLDCEECQGWNVEEPVTEASLVDFMRNVAYLVPAVNYGANELAWVAGLIAGWITRANKV